MKEFTRDFFSEEVVAQNHWDAECNCTNYLASSYQTRLPLGSLTISEGSTTFREAPDLMPDFGPEGLKDFEVTRYFELESCQISNW